jgi:beta-phosphoglucomutase
MAYSALMASVRVDRRASKGRRSAATPAHDLPTFAELSSDDAQWIVVEDAFDPGRQRAQETVFSVGNGRFATRGSLEEGYRANRPATLAHGIYAPHPLAHSELANLPDWTALDVHVDGERFSLESGEALQHRRLLDLRRGVLRREVAWRSPTGRIVELVFERFVSLVRPTVAAVRVHITPCDADAAVEVHARLNARPETDGLAHTQLEDQSTADGICALSVRIRRRDTHVALAMRLRTEDGTAEHELWDAREQPTLVARSSVAAGRSVTFEKTVALVTSRESDDPIDASTDALKAVAEHDFDALLAESNEAWERDWSVADVIIEGDDEAQLAVRFALFQLLISAPRDDDQASIGAKGLTGFGYRGHVFWDTETFMLPFFVHVRPDIARNLLSYRYHRLPGARRKAAANGVRGAQFPWESAETGDEVTPTWLPDATGRELVRVWTGDIALHISAMIALATDRYWRATGDDEWMVARGAALILESARFWASRAEWNEAQARYELRDVIGPDEYHEHVDNNAYTNHVAVWHLRAALELADWLERVNPQRARDLLGDEAETAATLAEFRSVADRIHLHFQRDDGVIEQFEGYFGLRDVDMAEYAERVDSMQALLGMEGVAETTIIKQPDVLMLAAVLPGALSQGELTVNYDYYGPRTDHTYGSSLGPAIHAMLAARLGRVGDAYEHFLRAARVDLADIRGNTEHGAHAASAGALWQAVVFGFAGTTFAGADVRTAPQLPPHWRRLAFKVMHHGRLVEVDLKSPGEPSVLPQIRGLIFDLDGVVTNTSEAHYLAWQRLADEEGLPFNRQANEALRGVTRRQSLALILGTRSVSADKADELMERKNRYYRELIARLTPADTLPGVLELIDEARQRGLKVGLASASKNAREVLGRLEIAGRFDSVVDGHTPGPGKPAPDLFLASATTLDLPPEACIVFEDAADGVAAAQAAGMMTVGIGPPQRVGEADVVLADGFEAINLDALLDLLVQSREPAT